jgi:hypothetical protein
MLIRTLFAIMWVEGERIVAVQPVEQFVPFFQVACHGADSGFDPGMQLLRDTKKPHAIRDDDMRVRTCGPDRITLGLMT